MKSLKTSTIVLAFLSPLFAACHVAPSDVLDRQEAFVYAAYDGNLEKMKALYVLGVDVNETTGMAGHKTAPSLKLAVSQGHLSVVEFLLDKQADVNVRDDDGSTPLMSAARRDNKEIARLLITSGADVNAVDAAGRTALSIATNENYFHPEVAEMLKQAGAKH